MPVASAQDPTPEPAEQNVRQGKVHGIVFKGIKQNANRGYESRTYSKISSTDKVKEEEGY